MSIEEQNKEIVRRWYAGYNTRDPEVVKKNVEELMAKDCVAHMEGAPSIYGSEAIERTLLGGIETCPESTQTFELIIAEGDYVALRESYVMKHTNGTFQGVPATGKTLTLTSHDIYKIVDGKIVEQWGQWGALGLLQQLGVVPEIDLAPES